MDEDRRPVALVTGASAGIGAATARALADAGFGVTVAARRLGRLASLARRSAATRQQLDVTDRRSVEQLAESIDRLDLLVNNAGAALGMEPVAELDEEHWLDMFELNVLAVGRMVRTFLPLLLRARTVARSSTSGPPPASRSIQAAPAMRPRSTA